jgi:DHA2 family multidrug resistance protein-like MFS transporter
MDLTVLYLATPSLSADLDPTSSQLLWILDVYGFVIAGTLVTIGTLGDRIGRRRLLLIGAAAFGAASVLAAVYGLKLIAEDGLGRLPALSVAAGLILGAAFVLRQRRLADPLVDLGLFRIPAFSAALAAITLAAVALSGTFLFCAQYLQLVLGLSPLRAGLWTVPQFVGLIAGSMLAPLIARRVRPAVVAGAGLALAAAGFGALTQTDGASGLAVLVAGSVVFSLGLAPVFALGTDMVVGAAPPERAGSASGLSETGNELGGALGIAILGSVGTAVYRNRIADALPADVPARSGGAAPTTMSVPRAKTGAPTWW